MTKYIKDKQGHFAGSIGDGKTKVPTSRFTIIKPVTTFSQVITATDNLERARVAYKIAQRNLETAKQTAKRTAEAKGISVTDDTDNQTIIKGTLDDGITTIDVAVTHFPAITHKPENENREESFDIRGTVNDIDYRFQLIQDPESGNWYGNYRKSTPGYLKRKPARGKVASYTLSRFFTNNENTNRTYEDTIYAVPLSKTGQALAHHRAYADVEEKYKPGLQKEIHQALNFASQIKDIYETNVR